MHALASSGANWPMSRRPGFFVAMVPVAGAPSYLRRLAELDDTFDYRIACNNDDGSITGVIWQTGYMRENFRRFGVALFLDAMKRHMNNLHWPYLSFCVIDGDGSSASAAEGLFCEERGAAHVFGVQSMLEMSYGRTADEVRAIFSDAILDDTILRKIGLTNSA